MNRNLENLSVLIVEDDADTREYLRHVLEQAGATVIEADAVDAAIRVFRQAPPHAILSDIRLGVSDGYALIKAVRDSNQEYRGFTPAIAMTGFSSPDEKERILAAGFDSYLIKPLDPQDIIDALSAALTRVDSNRAA